MGDLLNFEVCKRRLDAKKQLYRKREAKLKKTLIELKAYLIEENINIVEKETNIFIDFLLEKLNDSSNFINNSSSIAINLRNITKIKYNYTEDIDVLLWIDEYRSISLSCLRNFFGENFQLFFVQTENEYYHEETDSDYSTVDYLFTIIGPISEVKELNRRRFGNKQKQYKK